MVSRLAGGLLVLALVGATPVVAECLSQDERTFLDIGETARIAQGQVVIRFDGLQGDLTDAAFGNPLQKASVSSNIKGLNGSYPLRGRGAEETFVTFTDPGMACPGHEVAGTCAVARIMGNPKPKLVCKLSIH